jgi:hypothetical protein
VEADQHLVPCTVTALVLSLCQQSRLCAPGIAESIDAPRLYTHENLPLGSSWEEVKKVIASVNRASPVSDQESLCNPGLGCKQTLHGFVTECS